MSKPMMGKRAVEVYHSIPTAAYRFYNIIHELLSS
jgi:hypothetical protein